MYTVLSIQLGWAGCLSGLLADLSLHPLGIYSTFQKAVLLPMLSILQTRFSGIPDIWSLYVFQSKPDRDGA